MRWAIAHRISHECWQHCCETLSEIPYIVRKEDPAWPLGNVESKKFERSLHSMVKEDWERYAEASVRECSGWVKEDEKLGKRHFVRPAFDGLSIYIKDGKATDEYY